MKILHILDHSIPLQSGYTFRTRSILREQRALGWETEHVTSAKHEGAVSHDEWVDGLHFFRMPALPSWVARAPVVNQLAVSAQLARRLDPIIERVRPDVLHAHSPALNGFAALHAGRRHGRPVVYEVRAFWEDAAVDHGTTREWRPRYRLTRSLETYVLERADAITTICEGLRREIIARGLPSNKVTVIPNAVDAERFTYDPPRDRELAVSLGLPGATVLGYIGSFYAYEGLPLLVDALAGIAHRYLQLRLLLVGGGPDEPRIRARIHATGLADRVVLTGRVAHDQVARYYSLVDVLVYPRQPMRLTNLVTPLKPLEAMAQGRLVLASDVGGHRELIRDGETGVLFPGGNTEALARCVEQLLARRQQWDAIREAGRRFVESERTWKASVHRYRAVYAGLPGAAGCLLDCA